jgi:hypothetical protein
MTNSLPPLDKPATAGELVPPLLLDQMLEHPAVARCSVVHADGEHREDARGAAGRTRRHQQGGGEVLATSRLIMRRR